MEQNREGEKSQKSYEIKWIVPDDTQDILNKLEKGGSLINPYLSQNRFLCHIKEKTKDKIKEETVPYLYTMLKKGTVSGDEFCNGELMELACRLNARNLELSRQFAAKEKYHFKPYDKMIIGEGGGLYMGMQPLKLHPLYGIPYIPASTTKGVYKSAWTMVFENESSQERKDFIELFGSAGDEESIEGRLVFFDNFPEKFELGLDIQNVHYKEYYDATKPPTDDMDVNPVFFVCMTKSEFYILVACRDAALWERNKHKIDRVTDVVINQMGIGAKTALGYGIV